jgi:hypothetical protein
MPYLFGFSLDGQTAELVLPRASGGSTITLAHIPAIAAILPCDALVIRGGAVLTVLAITAAAGPVLTTSGAATGYADAALVVGDTLIFEPPDVTDIPSSLDAAPAWFYGSVGLGELALAVLADAAAPSPSVYLGSDHLDTNSSPKLCRKDSAGNVTVIG